MHYLLGKCYHDTLQYIDAKEKEIWNATTIGWLEYHNNKVFS